MKKKQRYDFRKTQKYYDENKEKFSEKAKQNITCECGCVVRIYKFSRHRRTDKHRNLMKQKKKINVFLNLFIHIIIYIINERQFKRNVLQR